ncbi:MAG: PilZ domain-containing protein [Myxococcales bacterium]|jgi:hypothetical protein
MAKTLNKQPAGRVRTPSTSAPPRARRSAAPAVLPSPRLEAGNESEPEHRRFPRAQVEVPFRLSILDEDGLPRFAASLRSVNLSVSGAFLASTFFLPVGTELQAAFRLDPAGSEIQALVEIVRAVRPEARTGESGSGFAVRFVEFFGRTEVTLARLFVGARLHAFAEEYLRSDRARSLGSELDRIVDALAAWELQKVLAPQDLWAGEA